MHVLAWGNGLRGKADDLVVTTHRFTSSHGTHGHLVTWRNQAAHSHTFYLNAREQLLSGDDNVIGGMEANTSVHEKSQLKKTLNGVTTGK
jgi:hypothetical protein